MSDDFESETVLTDEMPIIQNLTEHLVSPFEQLFDEISDIYMVFLILLHT